MIHFQEGIRDYLNQIKRRQGIVGKVHILSRKNNAHTRSQGRTKATHSKLRGDRIKHSSLKFSTSELHELIIKREKEKVHPHKGHHSPFLSPGLSGPPRTSGSNGSLSTRAHFPNGNKPDLTSITPLLSLFLQFRGTICFLCSSLGNRV